MLRAQRKRGLGERFRFLRFGCGLFVCSLWVPRLKPPLNPQGSEDSALRYRLQIPRLNPARTRNDNSSYGLKAAGLSGCCPDQPADLPAAGRLRPALQVVVNGDALLNRGAPVLHPYQESASTGYSGPYSFHYLDYFL